MVRTGRIDVDGGHVAYEVQGEGPLVVCAHGMGDTRGQFRLLAPALAAAGYRVVSIDLRGHGESDVSFDDYGPEAVGGDLIAVIEAHGGPAVLVGNSCAAASAVWAAAERPELVCKLVLLGPVARDGQVLPALLQRTLRFVLAGPWGRAIWLWWYRSIFKGGEPPDQAAHLAHLRAVLADRRRLAALWDAGTLPKSGCARRIPEVRAPALVVMGAADPDFPDAAVEARELGEALSAEVTVLEGVGHYPHLEVPEVTADRVLRFLQEVPCRASA